MNRTTLLILLCLLPLSLSAQSYLGMFDHNSLEREARRLQYKPDSEGYIVCENGKNLYTRALYGGNTAFRMETSDMPIFGAFHGKDNRNVHFIVEIGESSLRLDSVKECVSRYKGGERQYILSDPSWNKGKIIMTLLAPRSYEGGIWKIESTSMPKGARLKAVVCATRKIKLSRNGDMGADPANAFAPDPEGHAKKECRIDIGGKKQTAYFKYSDKNITSSSQKALAKEFAQALEERETLSSGLKITTPDPYFNTLGSVLTHSADGNFDGKVWLHGAIGWRMPLSGWRGAYSGDFLGWHDRGRSHFDAYSKSQVKDVEPVKPHPTQDSTKNIARAAKEWGTQMYSNGYICRNPERNDQMHHYDMNLCYIDELLWHLKWTGDMDYAWKMWPVIESHLAWEKRNFDPDNDGLYDAYCCIWASDALYYNSGAVTHSSAYNYRANKIAAEIAERIGKDPTPYKEEAEKILSGLNNTLWMNDKGVWAEFKDFMGHKRLHDHPALWTIYHAIDSDVADNFKAYSATRYIDNNIPHIPVTGEDLEDEDYNTLSTTDWLPYAWSINNVAFAETLHTALAYWQAGRPEEATHLLKSIILDGMYLGNSPGNIGQVSYYDAARGESYRDFADPTAMMARSLVQGLFGFNPDGINGTLTLRPGFPAHWDHASIEHPDFNLDFKREGKRETYNFSTCIDSIKNADIILRAPFDELVGVEINGQPVKWELNTGSIDYPAVKISTDIKPSMKIDLLWSGSPLDKSSGRSTGRQRDGFEEVASGDMRWWKESGSFRHSAPENSSLGIDLKLSGDNKYEPIDLSSHYNANVTDIFRNRYESPRSPYTTLQIPIQGIGEWCHPDDTAHIDDSGIRKMVDDKGILMTSLGIPFSVAKEDLNVVYTSLFDNYPDSVTIGLRGKARGLELLMAGSTNHMQCHLENARVRVTYKDGSQTTLPLIAPYNWAPIEQDYYIDGKQFRVETPRPYRIVLKDGRITDNLESLLEIKGVYGRRIDGGAGILLCMDLDPEKELDSFTLETLSNDIVTGIIGASYIR